MKIGYKHVLLGHELGLSEADVKQIRKVYPHTFTLMILFKWKLQRDDEATFRNLEMAFRRMDIDVDIIRSVNTTEEGVSCLPPNMLGMQPEDKHLKRICSGIGTKRVHLGVELEVPLSKIDQIVTENPFNVQRQCLEIMKEWRQRNVKQATFRKLEQAFICIGIDPDLLNQSVN